MLSIPALRPRKPPRASRGTKGFRYTYVTIRTLVPDAHCRLPVGSLSLKSPFRKTVGTLLFGVHREHGGRQPQRTAWNTDIYKTPLPYVLEATLNAILTCRAL